jgi:Flp pilus assembly protein TadG
MTSGPATRLRKLIRHILSKRLRSLLRSESGQALPVIAFMIIALLGMVGIVVDIGHVYICQRELQAACDASALAGAAVIPTSTTTSNVLAVAANFDAAGTGNNTYSNLPNVSLVPGYPVPKCLATMQLQGISCVGYLPYNALQVKLQAPIPMYFARLFGKSSMTITASSTAAKGGGSSKPYNIVIMLDTTLSMNNYDSDCGATQMTCALQGLQVLLKYLDPCGTSQAACTITAGNSANSVVRVSIFTFPQMTYPTVANDSSCSGANATAATYTFPPAAGVSYTPGTSNNSTTYRVTDFQSDYRLSDLATSLNTSSNLVIASGGVSGCAGMGAPANAGNYGTYYAATMYAAQAALVQEALINPGSQNVLIVLGDGDANAPQTNGPYTVMGSGATASGLYPSWKGECGQAIDAGASATAQGTTVYTVAYGAPSSGCTTDVNAGTHQNVSPCNEMSQIASHSWDFFSDFKQSGSNSTCVAAQVVTSLSDIFLQIAGDLTVARLVSDSTT